MSRHNYNWNRFWVKREDNINLTDGGYLWYSDSVFEKIENPKISSFEKMSRIPCLVLLGEPGIGKSTEIKKQWNISSQKSQKTGEPSLHFDLRNYQTDFRLCQEIFYGNQDFQNWRNGKGRLSLFLDSLDEGLLEIKILANLLYSEFQKFPVDRLNLRIACRTAEWPDLLESELKELWGANSVEVYELAPLRRIDVIEAANVNGIDSKLFLDEVDRKEAVPFAIKPITLTFLLNSYSRNKQLPASQEELFVEGCRHLCEEKNPSRLASNRQGRLTASQRLSVSARIAALTTFCNKGAIYTAPELGNLIEKELSIREMCGGKESADEYDFEVDEAAIKETLSTGLFSSRGQNRLGWSHKSYAEFLAAWYVKQHKMSITQIKSMLIHPTDPEQKLIPQLNDTAAWLAGMIPELFSIVIEIEPEVLLRSDLAARTEDERKALVEALLTLYQKEQSIDTDWDLKAKYKKLTHANLAKQLRPWITDNTRGPIARKVAINIAEACNLKELQSTFTDIALDVTQPISLRIWSAYAICRFGDDEYKTRLKPLALGKAGEDPDDELKGCGLRAVWPKHISAEELFESITPPKRENLIGAYKLFLTKQLSRHIQPIHLPAALKWVESLDMPITLSNPFRDIVDKIMFLGWKNISSETILQRFAKAALSRLRHVAEIVNLHGTEFNKEFNENDSQRRTVIQTIVLHLAEMENDSSIQHFFLQGIALSKDFFWMIQKFRHSDTDNLKNVWAELISWAFDRNSAEHVDAILTEGQENSIICEKLPWLFRSVILGSEEAERMKRMHSAENQRQMRRESTPKMQPPNERITKILRECEAGDSRAWLKIIPELARDSEDSDYGNWFQPAIEILPGWKAANPTEQTRILDAAKKYVLNQRPSMKEVIENHSINHSVFAGYTALRLLLQFDESFVLTLKHDVWNHWIPIILYYTPDYSGQTKSVQDLIAIAYDCAPDAFIDALLLLIDSESRDDREVHLLRKLETFWDNRMENALLNKAQDEKLKPRCMGSLLRFLLNKSVDEAKEIVRSTLKVPIPAEKIERSKAVVSASLMMTYFEDAGWQIVWPAIQSDEKFGREIIHEFTRESHNITHNVLRRLNEKHLGELFVWLARRFPYESSTNEKYGYTEEFRNSVLQNLKQRGTLESCKIIEQISQELPELDWLKWTLREARIIARRNTWKPPSPSQILQIAKDTNIGLVNNGEQLLCVIIDSLKRLESKLQGETPASIDLWNEIKKNVFRPKDENRLSDYIKRHFEDDIKRRGIIANREVEIRRGSGGNAGERTDIHIDALIRNSDQNVFDVITVIVEVKGCWHDKLLSAMQTQLADRYLKDNQCKYGLYLVGWFNCGQWDESDKRKRQAFKNSKTDIQQTLKRRAQKLSNSEMIIRSFVLNTALR